MAMPAQALDTDARRIAVVCPSGAPLRQLHDLLREVTGRGHSLLALAPGLTEDDAALLSGLGADHKSISGKSAGFKLVTDWKSIVSLKGELGNWSPDAVLAYGGQTMVYGALAAKAIGTRRIVLVVDALPEHRFSDVLAEGEMPAWRYAQAFGACDHAIFYGREDLALLRNLAVVPEELPVSVLPGSGVSLDECPIRPLPTLANGLVFLMAATLDHRHGVREYCEAAAIVRRRAPNTRIILAGMGGQSAVDVAELKACDDIEFYEDAMRHPDLIEACHVFVYPSVADGMPQPVLDAMTAGRPVIVADVPGCRATVDERVNGCLFEPRNVEGLAEAMESYLKRPDLIPSMARASRAKAERFATTTVVRRNLLNILGLE
jgi:glycosyltransferase involved in cell wall biosynthesis